MARRGPYSSARGSSQARKTSMHPLISMLGIFITLTVVLAVFLLAYWYHTDRITTERSEGSGYAVDGSALRRRVGTTPTIRALADPRLGLEIQLLSGADFSFPGGSGGPLPDVSPWS